MLASRVSPSKRALLRWFAGATALLCAALTGCAGGGGLGHTRGAAVQGKLEANGTGLGTFEAAVSSCASGAPQHFFGVDLLSSDRDTQVRIVLDPMGRAEVGVRRSEQPGVGLLLDSSNCARLDIGLEHGRWHVSDIQEVRGNASFDCELATGGRVKGEFSFSRCY